MRVKKISTGMSLKFNVAYQSVEFSTGPVEAELDEGEDPATAMDELDREVRSAFFRKIRAACEENPVIAAIVSKGAHRAQTEDS